jgi:hypothetical protein
MTIHELITFVSDLSAWWLLCPLAAFFFSAIIS